MTDLTTVLEEEKNQEEVLQESGTEQDQEKALQEEKKDEAVESIEQAMDEATAAPPSTNLKQGGDNKPHWYVIHTYSGYENKVKVDIEKTIENRRLQEQMFEVLVPMQEITEIKKGVRKRIQKKMFPGYVIVHMILNDVTWYVVRNTRGVTGFVGPGSEPVPLTDTEMRMFGVKPENLVIDVAVGDAIRVISGAWEGSVGTVKQISSARQTVTIEMDVLGRFTDVEISLDDVLKL